MTRLSIGTLSRPRNRWSLSRQYFPSKVGGVPAWLNPLNIPSGSSSVCDFCGDPLRFLLQVHAPIYQENISTYHRMLFVFMCPSMTCLLKDQHGQRIRHDTGSPSPSRRSSVVNYLASIHFTHTNGLRLMEAKTLLAVKVGFLLCRSAQHNAVLHPVGSEAALCDWCGTWKGDKLCSGCNQLQYCSEMHQDMSWRLGHGIACQQRKVSSPICGPTSLEHHKVGGNNAWPEFQILIDDILEHNASETYKIHDSLISKIRVDDIDDDDTCFLYFQECTASASDQVLRYYRDNKAKPIWPVLEGRSSKADIPNCNYCGGPMCCEFQILPLLQDYFDDDPDCPVWATIVVYACEASCVASLPYKQEYAWVQLYE